MTWAQHRVDTLSHLWHEGLTATQIARKMRITRNTVLGKANRMGLPARCERWRGSRELRSRIEAAKFDYDHALDRRIQLQALARLARLKAALAGLEAM